MTTIVDGTKSRNILQPHGHETESKKVKRERCISETMSFQTCQNLRMQGIEADAVGFSVYCWAACPNLSATSGSAVLCSESRGSATCSIAKAVRLRGFRGEMATDLAELQKTQGEDGCHVGWDMVRHGETVIRPCATPWPGYNYVELRVTFKEDLHPFYPPTIAVVRPQLHGRYDVQAALACHPRLQLKGWSPFQLAAQNSRCRISAMSHGRVDLQKGPIFLNYCRLLNPKVVLYPPGCILLLRSSKDLLLAVQDFLNRIASRWDVSWRFVWDFALLL